MLQFACWSPPDGRVIAFEPNPCARQVLERHIRLNKLDNRVQLVPAAVGATPGEVTLYAADTDGMSRLGTPNPIIADRVVPIPVPMVTLDNFCRRGGLVPDWLLIDIRDPGSDRSV